MEYVIMGIVVGALIGGIAYWAKKTNERQAERMKLLSEEQKNYLKEVGCIQDENNGNLVSTVAVLTNIKEGESKKQAIDFIFWNAWTQKLEMGDSKLSKELIEKENIKVGDYITLIIKTKDGIIDGIKEVKEYKK